MQYRDFIPIGGALYSLCKVRGKILSAINGVNFKIRMTSQQNIINFYSAVWPVVFAFTWYVILHLCRNNLVLSLALLK